MANGVDPTKGHVLVPFDLKNDVILPLERLEDGLQSLNQRFDEHLSYVNDEVKGRMAPVAEYVEARMKTEKERAERRAKAKKWIVAGASVAGSVIAALIGHIFGLGGL